MRAHRALAAAAAVAILVAAPHALGDPLPLPQEHVEIRTGNGVIRMPGGLEYLVPTGSHIIQPEAYKRLDEETRRLQEVEVRLTAENKSMRASLASWQPGWMLLSITGVVAFVGGMYAFSRL